MSFYFTCPYCHHRTLVDDKYAGSSGPCAECGKSITLPGPSSSSNPSRVPSRAASASRFIVKSIVASIIVLTTVGIASLFILPAMRRVTAARNREVCLSNMQQIARALDAYATKHGTYPTPVVTDSTGKKLYSWRVLILPELGYGGLFKEFQLDQAWDSPTNFALIQSMPSIFASPGSPDAISVNESNYVLLVGTGTLFPASGPLGPDDIADAKNQTILLAETVNSRFKWTQPSDIDASLGVSLGNRPFVDIGGNHQDGINVVAADGTKIVLPKSIDPAMLEALKTPSGGERIDTSTIEHP